MRARVVGGALAVLTTTLIVSAVTRALAQEGGSGAEASPPSQTPVALPPDELQAAIDQLPDPTGENDTEQLRSLLGLPDAFTLAFEPQADGSISRREQWFYFDLSTAFEFVDGSLLWNLPLDAETTFLVNASHYDPAVFEDWMTWSNVRTHVPNPFSFEEVALDEEYGVPATIYVGGQLVLAFDEEGKILYAETIPLTAAEAP